MIHIIAAMSQNRVIGNKNKIPWHLPQDLARFKELTMGHWIVMGRKTYESIGRPLPGRTNVVITKNLSAIEDHSKIILSNSLDAILDMRIAEEIFIIGGGELYRQAIDRADILHMTLIEKYFNGDTYFPEIDLGKWRLIDEISGNADGIPNNGLRWKYQTYRRNEKI